MSTAAVPEPDESRDRPDTRPGGESCALSERDRRILGEITAHETGADPAFAGRLRGPRWRIGPVTQLVLQILAVAAVALVVAPHAWSVIVFATAVVVTAAVLHGWIRTSPRVRGRRPEQRD